MNLNVLEDFEDFSTSDQLFFTLLQLNELERLVQKRLQDLDFRLLPFLPIYL